jgi:hypothetical protein
MTMSNLMIFLAGLFFGGAIDHVILALAGRVDTPYGVDVGVAGNWAMAALDIALTGGAWMAHRRLERHTHPRA